MAFTATDLMEKVQKSVGIAVRFVGVDIGSFSTKIVQLSINGGVVTLDTYGEIENAPYAGSEPGAVIRENTSGTSAGLQDLLHEVGADSRRCGVAVSLAETLFNTVDLPKRDPEQMARIVPVEAKQYIPMPIEKVMLDWYVIPDSESDSVFDVLSSRSQTVAKTQKVMLVAVKKETALVLSNIINETPLTPDFFEIEMFSVVRSCAHEINVPTLILDFGALATKAYIVNETEIATAARLIPVGGQNLTEAIRQALSCNYAEAERLKCENGLISSDTSSVITSTLSPMWAFVQQMLEDQKKTGGKPIARVLLIGGGSYLPGIIDLVASKLSLPVEMANAFKRSRGPMILENVLKEDGPRFAVAMGLALRGIGK
jgi:type IV pilus assembly protein PilM